VKGENSAQVLVGKKVGAFPDVRLKPGKWYGTSYDGGGLDHVSVEWLLKLTAGDKVTIPRKYIGAWEGVVPIKLWLMSNEVPNFNDTVLPGRWIKLRFGVSFANREDLTLMDQLRGERAGIAQRAVAAYRRLCRRGRFVQPASGAGLKAKVEAQSDPFTEFMLETFVPDPEGTVQIGVIMLKLEAWRERYGRVELRRIIRPHLLKNIVAVEGFRAVKNAPRVTDPETGDKPRCYLGLRLRTAKEQEED
jgi:phage/plasmid-associated DNA primase